MEIGGIKVGCATTAESNKGWEIAYNSTDNKVTITAKASKGTGVSDYPTK